MANRDRDREDREEAAVEEEEAKVEQLVESAPKPKVTATELTPDSDRLEGFMTITDPDGVEHKFEIPKGADLKNFEADHLNMVAYRHYARKLPGMP